MDKQTVSFRLDSETLGALDAVARGLDRDRTYVLSEAVAAYLEVQQWHIDQIKTGIRQANAGKMIDHAQVRKTFDKRSRNALTITCSRKTSKRLMMSSSVCFRGSRVWSGIRS